MSGKKPKDLIAGRYCADCAPESVVNDVMEQGGYGYAYVVAPVTHPRCCLDPDQLSTEATKYCARPNANRVLSDEASASLLPPIAVPDIAMEPFYWHKYVAGTISPWIDPDSDDLNVRRLSEKALEDELRYFSYLTIGYVLIPLRSSKSGNLARLVSQHLQDATIASFAVWVVVPFTSTTTTTSSPVQQKNDGRCSTTTMTNGEIANGDAADDDNENDPASTADDCNDDNDDNNNSESESTWRWYYEFRAACNNDSRICACLGITPESRFDDPVALERWKGEQLRAIKFNTRLFSIDPKSPTTTSVILSPEHEKLTKELFASMDLHAIIDGPDLHSAAAASDISNSVEWPLCPYYKYLNSLFTNKPVEDAIAQWARGYEDYLQSPLQPLGDNLESQVYETFEKDPIKYEEYERAIDAAVASKCDNENNPDSMLVVMVLGAGRGPLVSAAYSVLKKRQLSNSFKLYAVEKNPHALLTLNEKCAKQWNNEVEVINSDMRHFKPVEKADIVISELLGSFGDNELSPECLDGASHLMKEDCVSIPRSYSSFIGPIHSPRLEHAIYRMAHSGKSSEKYALENGYVVRIHNYFEIAPPRHLFAYSHPNFNKNRLSNDRYKELSFSARETSEIMGFVGYFTTVLYDDVILSILPRSHSRGLFSWFPILFPIQEPILVKKGERIRLRFWRCSDETRVWYEWQLVEPVCLPIANTNGRGYAMRLE